MHEGWFDESAVEVLMGSVVQLNPSSIIPYDPLAVERRSDTQHRSCCTLSSRSACRRPCP